MDRVGFRPVDHLGDAAIIRQRGGQPDLADDRALLLQQARRLVHRPRIDRVERLAAGTEIADIADHEPPDARMQRLAIVGYRHVGAGRVGGVMAGDRLHHDGIVLDRPGQRPGMVERPAIGQAMGSADAAEGPP